MNDSELSAQVAAEITALHVEFERWFRGESDDPGRIEASIPDEFAFVTPQGDVVGRAALLENLRGGRGARRIRIRVENVVVRWSGANAVLATYEEWHDHVDYTTARMSTVLFARDGSAPAGLSWRHVHETWKIPPPHRQR